MAHKINKSDENNNSQIVNENEEKFLGEKQCQTIVIKNGFEFFGMLCCVCDSSFQSFRYFVYAKEVVFCWWVKL